MGSFSRNGGCFWLLLQGIMLVTPRWFGDYDRWWWAPRVDIAETEKEFIIKAEIPEVKKEEVKISVDNGILSIRGERKQEKEEKGKKFHRVERYYGSFTRSFTLPDNVDETKIEASFKDGMLNIQIPKSEKSKPKAIDVKIK